MSNFNRCKAVLMIWIMLLLVACASGPLCSTLPPKTSEPTDNIPCITTEELKTLIDKGADLVVVDTQDERIYHVKHIKGAINFPWAPVIREPMNLPRTKLLILYCGCAGEEASKNVARQLMSDWGFKQIKVLDGGFSRWLRLGYPTEP